MSKVGAIILAAGGSSRFGKAKQLVEIDGKSLLHRVVDAATNAGCSPIVVVLGSESERMQIELSSSSVAIARNSDWRHGIGASIRTGVNHLVTSGDQVDAVILLVCDQPLVDGNVIRRLIATAGATKNQIVASSYAGTVGVPALFGRSFFDELLQLSDDRGAKPLILSNRDHTALVPFPEGEIDIDTVEDWDKL